MLVVFIYFSTFFWMAVAQGLIGRFSKVVADPLLTRHSRQWCAWFIMWHDGWPHSLHNEQQTTSSLLKWLKWQT